MLADKSVKEIEWAGCILNPDGLVSINGASALKFNLAVFFNAGLKVDVILIVFLFVVSCAHSGIGNQHQ